MNSVFFSIQGEQGLFILFIYDTLTVEEGYTQQSVFMFRNFKNRKTKE